MKICFWGNFGGALYSNPLGGGELQIALLAKVLAKAGNEIVILDISADEKYQTEDGITVFPINGWNNGIRIIRTLTHRLPRFYTSLINQNADVYYCRIRDFRHIIVFWAARKVKAKLILGIASDLDISDFKTRWIHFYSSNLRTPWVFFNGLLSEIVYPFLLHKSDCVLVQHSRQKDSLLRRKINSLVSSNLINPDEIPVISHPDKKDFIYVGSLDKRKGFKEFFNLVKKTPSIFYKVVGKPRDKTGYFYYEKLKTFKNIALLGSLEHSETIFQIANSKALISTSPMEGFPNVFIEAWACGVPVLSLYIDPGSVIKNEKLGKVANGNMIQLIDMVMDFKTTDEFANRSKTYVDRNHLINGNKIKEIGNLFIENSIS